jgi:pimeloyl-ACP methyl ester carboxylesterase
MTMQKATIHGDGAAEAIVTRVVSGDGTPIADWTSGQGPPLVLVHGTTADHTRWRPLLPYLEPHATVHALDRRGRGASGDAPDYSVVRSRTSPPSSTRSPRPPAPPSTCSATPSAGCARSARPP